MSLPINWFSRLTGFNEHSYASTQAQLEVHGDTLHSKVNGHSFGIGQFEMVSLAELRARVAQLAPNHKVTEPTRLSVVTGDVRQMHQQPEYANALFQVASQFNALEMVGPSVTPEMGVTRYENDRTQGPACAIAAGAATIYRNYLVPLGDQVGQTADRQLDGLAGLGSALSQKIGCTVADLWSMQNGYALATPEGLKKISAHLRALDGNEHQALAGHLRVGLHSNVEVTDGPVPIEPQARQRVSQVFCSALPVAYSQLPALQWEPFAQLVLDAAYEATLLAALLNHRQGGSDRVLLTMLGGGAFGNATGWIHSAIERALAAVQDCGLNVLLVSYGAPTAQLKGLVARYQASVAQR
jgi:hypothetical protein